MPPENIPAPVATPPPAAPPGGSFLATPPVAGNTPPPAATPPANSNDYPATDWRASLPDDLKADPSFRAMNDVTSLAKSFVHAQKLVGADKVPLPGKHATDDDWQVFYDKVGRPPLDKYDVALPKDAKFIDPEWMAELKPLAHKMGMMPAQLEKFAQWYETKTATTMKAQQEADQKAVDQDLADLKTEWGAAHDQKSGYAKAVFQKILSPEEQQWLNVTGVGNSPAIIKAFAKIGELLYKEDNIAPGGGNGHGVFSPSEATKKANEILMDSSHPYNRADHPNHKAALQEVEDLFKMAHPAPLT